MNKLQKAIANPWPGTIPEIKDCPQWMAPYDKMLLQWVPSETGPDWLWHVLPYRSDTDQFHYEVEHQRERAERKKTVDNR